MRCGFTITIFIWGLACSANALAGGFDADSSALLAKVSAYVAHLDHFSFSASVYTKRAACPETERAEYKFAFERPNHLAMSMKLCDESLDATADGNKVLLALKSTKEYEIRNEPEDLGTFVGWLTQQPAFRRLFSRQLTAGWLENVHCASCSQEEANGRPCDRLEMTFSRTDLTIWFEQGDVPIPVRLTADLSRTLNQPKGALTTEILWKDWNTDKQDMSGMFEVKPPQAYREVKAFGEDKARALDEQAGHASNRALLGRHAPPFLLELLDNTSTGLRDHIGKDTVLLEFWSTYCGPCRCSLRDIENLLPRLKKENTAVYAVNLMEPREKVADFIDKMRVKIPVALDPKGELAEQLRLEAVPTSVLIGRDGSIQAVHVGYDHGFIPQICDEVGTLAKGKLLVENPQHPFPGSQLRQRLQLDSQAYCAVFVGY
jgi:peroxiredoxin